MQGPEPLPGSAYHTASAPGKVVLWGEYAVLAGAPAAAVAVNRRATVTTRPATDAFIFSTSGFKSEPARLADLTVEAPPEAAAVACAVARELAVAPATAEIQSDTTAFFERDTKVGIGSSAAVLVATCGALARNTGTTPTVDMAMAAHRRLQGGGSGLDVVTAMTGGAVRFQSGRVVSFEPPATITLTFYFTGTSASTPDHLKRFSRWREAGDTAALNALAKASETLFDGVGSLSTWQNYTQALEALDKTAGLNIYTPTHAALAQQAKHLGLVYKPCGAGGGDVGVLVSLGAAQDTVASFTAGAERLGCTNLHLSIDPVGLSVHA